MIDFEIFSVIGLGEWLFYSAVLFGILVMFYGHEMAHIIDCVFKYKTKFFVEVFYAIIVPAKYYRSSSKITAEPSVIRDLHFNLALYEEGSIKIEAYNTGFKFMVQDPTVPFPVAVQNIQIRDEERIEIDGRYITIPSRDMIRILNIITDLDSGIKILKKKKIL